IEGQNLPWIARRVEFLGADANVLIALYSQRLNLVLAKLDIQNLLGGLIEGVERRFELRFEDLNRLHGKDGPALEAVEQVQRLAHDEQAEEAAAGHHQRRDEQWPENALAEGDIGFGQRFWPGECYHGDGQKPGGD